MKALWWWWNIKDGYENLPREYIKSCNVVNSMRLVWWSKISELYNKIISTCFFILKYIDKKYTVQIWTLLLYHDCDQHAVLLFYALGILCSGSYKAWQRRRKHWGVTRHYHPADVPSNRMQLFVKLILTTAVRLKTLRIELSKSNRGVRVTNFRVLSSSPGTW